MAVDAARSSGTSAGLIDAGLDEPLFLHAAENEVDAAPGDGTMLELGESKCVKVTLSDKRVHHERFFVGQSEIGVCVHCQSLSDYALRVKRHVQHRRPGPCIVSALPQLPSWLAPARPQPSPWDEPQRRTAAGGSMFADYVVATPESEEYDMLVDISHS